MALQIFQRTIVDQQGNVVNGASVTVRSEATGALAPIYTTRAGDVLKANPIVTGVDGFVEFYAPAGEYRVEAVFGGNSIVWRYVNLLEIAQDASGNASIAGTLVSGTYTGFRNKIINGNFAINQRNYVSGAAVGAANTYTLDRWRVVTSGQNVSFTTSGNGRTVTAPAGGLEQVIEGGSIEGGTYIINWTGTATCTVGGVARAKGATFTLTAGSNATVRFSGGTVSKVQLEPGLAVTVFEERPIGLELMLCRRYFRPLNAQNVILFCQGTTQAFGSIPYGSPMRVAPSVVFPASATLVFGAASTQTITTFALDSSTVDVLSFICTATSLSTGQASRLISLSAPILLSAEL